MKVRLMGQPIPVIGERCSHRYLGRPVGHTRLSCPPLQVLAEAEQAARLVLNNALAPWQKLDALRAFILPRLTATAPFDAELRWRVKGVLQLPSRACQEYLHASTSRGCVGLTELASEADILLMASQWQLLTSPDEFVRETAASQLQESAAALLREAVRQAAAERLYRLPHHGKLMQTIGDQRVSSHYMYSGSFTRFAEWRFVHRAQLGLVPLNGVRRSRVRGDERCRRCGYARETLHHVLCDCMPHSAAFQRRHNA
ncbi:uncharacterized protein LOC119114684 [Pollicipes pollicipes]|uniref:uncharacterized protein LOC119114684 n=1 Tax=Pollicipes pollicipes TaxID=41117 RepID=UPI0018858C1A|nr:uncharacterized protein LOC119114684 [Pollicipes pollicipes]